jgi:hypothetical protein
LAAFVLLHTCGVVGSVRCLAGHLHHSRLGSPGNVHTCWLVNLQDCTRSPARTAFEGSTSYAAALVALLLLRCVQA